MSLSTHVQKIRTARRAVSAGSGWENAAEQDATDRDHPSRYPGQEVGDDGEPLCQIELESLDDEALARHLAEVLVRQAITALMTLDEEGDRGGS